MGQKNSNFANNIKTKQNTKNNPQEALDQKQRAKIKLIEKYNLSEKETDAVLKRLEKEINKESLKNKSPQNNKESLNDKKGMKSANDNKSEKWNEQQIIGKNITENNKFNEFDYNEQDKVILKDLQQKDSHDINASEKHGDVDNILSEIIPDYNKHVSVELENVYLTFEVSNEKVDTFKELFIRTMKRDRPRKFKVEALKNVSFKIYKGEKVGIIGYNGAGKSTLLNVITGIFLPERGHVKTYGKISPLLSLGAGFDYNYSGRKNIYLNGAVLGYDKEFINSKIDEIIAFSELGEYIDIPIKNYSSGMLAKLGFSIATAVNPDILIIDEILSVGDVTFNKKSADKIRSLMDGGTTVLLVSHSIPQIRELCDRAIWIDHGCVREIGEVNKVCDHYLKDAEKASKEQLANISLYQS